MEKGPHKNLVVIACNGITYIIYQINNSYNSNDLHVVCISNTKRFSHVKSTTALSTEYLHRGLCKPN